MQTDKHKEPNYTWINMTGAGGLTSILFNLLHSKKYKADRHSQPPYSLNGYKEGIQEHISPGYWKGRTDMHKNRIFCSICNWKTKQNIKNRSYKSPHTTHTTPHSSLHGRQKDLYWYPQTLPCTVQLGEVYKLHTTYRTAPVKTRFTCCVIASHFQWRGS